MPKISVIVPVYQAEACLERCILSVVSQSFPDWELILVDDGSTDGSGRICDEWAGRESRIRVLHQKNGGVSIARNAGLEQAAGEYIAFCDSDDALRSELFAVCLKLAEENAAELVQFGYARRSEESGAEAEPLPLKPGASQADRLLLLSDRQERCRYLLARAAHKERGWEVWSGLFRRDLLETRHIHFHGELGFGEDLCFTLETLLYAERVVLSDRVLYEYNDENPGSIMHTSRKALRLDSMQAAAAYLWDCYIRALGPDRDCLCRLYHEIVGNQLTELYLLRSFRALGKIPGWQRRLAAMKQRESFREQEKSYYLLTKDEAAEGEHPLAAAQRHLADRYLWEQRPGRFALGLLRWNIKALPYRVGLKLKK